MNEALYDAAYFDRMRGDSELYERFLSVVPPDSYQNKRVLDVGCGRGDLLRRLIEAGCRDVSGLDFSSAAVAEAGRKLEKYQRDVSIALKQGSVEERALFEPDSFDLAFMTDVVEHIPPATLHAGLENVRHWLKASGRVVVHTFPTLGLHRLYQRLLSLQGRSKELENLNAIHYNVHTRKSLSGALESAGLRVEKIWIQNDCTLTSSAYKSLKPGPLKNTMGVLLDNVLGAAITRRVLGEYAAPSIYVIASKS